MKIKFICLIICLFCSQFLFGQSSPEQGLHTDSISYDGLQRKYMYYIPSGIENLGKIPVVFFLHGMGASAQIGVNVLGPQYHARAERDKAIVVYPDASSKHWNDKLGGSYPLTDNIDDVGYLSSLIDLFIRDFKGDPKRVYFSGSSNGGMMTYRLSCDIPEKIRAIAPFVSTISPGVAREFENAKPIPIIITSGTADSVIKWNGGSIKVTGTPVILSGDENVTYWVARNGTKKKAKITYLPDVEPGDNSTVEIQHYKGKNDVILYKIIGGAHTHPTLRAPGKALVKGLNMDYNSFERVWDFMMSYK
ncbi:MAG: PHB depolymerase family esterase [Daejeonella sp.]|uniref:alpha/beta hydrolase family esterase n=1 Tax=Daejeonella sp. TaxID=2805397 RepID=UPI0027330903|nr:PHB depolymerase family esterase [Daejeonella sp.]MDP3469392.1 PHB depolymerase family esterase [Daejeonella sp.]